MNGPIRVLLVHVDPEMQELMQDHLEEITSAAVVVHPERDQKRAQIYLQTEACDLVVAHANVPADRKDRSESRRGGSGLEFLRALRRDGNAVPFILIVETGGDEAIEVQDIDRARVVRDGTKMRGDLLDKVPVMLEPSPQEEHRVQLDITLDLDNQVYIWELAVRDGKSVTAFPAESLNLDMRAIQEILYESGELPDKLKSGSADWQQKLQFVGQHLAEMIFEGNPKLLASFQHYLTPENPETARIRFTVAKKIYPAVLEAVVDSQDEKFWMLKAPVYRRLKVQSMQNQPLFRGAGDDPPRLNCLIIESNVDGQVEQFGMEFRQLDNVTKEACWLEGFLTDNATAFGIGEVLRICEPEAGRSFSRTLSDALLEPRGSSWTGWHLVHYAGHSYYDKEGRYRDPNEADKTGAPDTGYILLPDHPADCVDAQTFASWLSRGGARLLYLSSCHSSEEDFAFQLASKMVPAVVGFRWDVDDAQAKEYTAVFYKHLFEKRSLESAFYLARREMNDRSPTDPIWASPVLILQVEDE